MNNDYYVFRLTQKNNWERLGSITPTDNTNPLLLIKLAGEKFPNEKNIMVHENKSPRKKSTIKNHFTYLPNYYNYSKKPEFNKNEILNPIWETFF